MSYTIELRIKTDDPHVSRDLVADWLKDNKILLVARGHEYRVDITYVKEREE